MENEVILNKVPIHNRLKPDKRTVRRYRPTIIADLDSDSSQSNESEFLKEPEEKITLIERAIGYFNADQDDTARKNVLNKSIAGGPPFVCTICSNWFYLGSKLKLHYILNHKIPHCEVCSNLFENIDDKNTHLSKFHSPMFCEICQNYFTDISELLQHYEETHNSTTCQFCGILLQPQSMSANHISRKHCVHPNYLDDPNQKIVTNVENSVSEFFCGLCNKNREMEIFFGHMNSHHKLNVANLMNLMVKLDIIINVSGAKKDDVEGERDEGKVYKNSCPICLTRYTKKIPKEFHAIYCENKVQCKFCEKQFSNTTFLDKHFKKMHYKFLCAQGCPGLAYNSHENLQKHYIKFHETVNCRYCADFLPISQFESHFEEKHKFKALIMKNFTDSLFEVTEKQNKHIVVCCLCDENISLLAEKVQDIFKHYNLIHSVSLLKILQLIGSKPMLEDYEDFYREINDSIKKENEGVEEETTSKQEEIVNNADYLQKIPKIKIKLEPVHQEESDENEENESEEETDIKKDKFENYSHLESEILSDFDVDEAEIIVNSDSELEDENLDLTCEFCTEKSPKLIDLVKHITDKHRLRSKYKRYKCEYCPEIIISYKTHANHLLGHHNNPNFDISKELFNCDCNNYQVVHSLARNHVLKVHKTELGKYSVDDIGLQCRFCKIRKWERSEMNEHELEEHFSDNMMDFQKCSSCLKVFSSQKCLSDHSLSTHPELPHFSKFIYKCLNCTFVYPTLHLLRDHFSTDHPTSKIFKCPVPHCTKFCKRERFIIKHLNAPHQVKQEQADICEVCGKKFKSIRAATIHKLMKHQRDRAGFQCRICNERFATIEQRKLHYTTAHPGQLAYNCLECGKGFISKSGLYGHRKIHQQNNNLVCPYCSKEFSRRDSYNEHLLIHVGPRHQCPHCPKSFTQRSNLTRHVRIHTGAKPYQCMYCEKRFSDRGACRSHERVHTKEEHCECSYCGKKFTKKQKLKYHIKFHTGEGLMDCEVCGKQFSNSYSLNEHRKIHNQQTLVMCNCGRGFSSEKYLQRHMANVHNESATKYICPVCFKTLFHKSSYNDHIMTHSGIKHVRCLLCNKEYNTKKTAKRHIQEQHNLRKTEEIYKFIYQLTPQEAGLNLPTASEMAVNVTDLLKDQTINFDGTQLPNLTSDTENSSQSVMQNSDENGARIQIKEEPVSDEDDLSLEIRARRKFKKPVKNIKTSNAPK